MNDCFWAFIDGDCKNCICNGCKEYLSVNTEKGMEVFEKYQKDVDEALKPVSEKWKKDKESGVYGRD